jgi:hypothetical protein
MWELYLRYYTTEGSHDLFGEQVFSTLEAAVEAVQDIIYDDFLEHERVEGFEEEDYGGDNYPRYPGNWDRISPGDYHGEFGNWYLLPHENTDQLEVLLAYAHLHSQYDWTFRDDKVEFFVMKV